MRRLLSAAQRVTTSAMSAVASPPPPVSEDSARSWEQLRANEDIQFAPVQMPQQAPREPGWIERFLTWLGEIFSDLLGGAIVGVWPVLKWVLLAALIAAVIYMLWQLFDPLGRGERSQAELEEEPEWHPDQDAAVALLEDAELLAAEGKFDEATHLLLQRSVSHMSSARSDWVEPSSTARELARTEGLPDDARAAFTVIAERVERSLFALTHLNRDDWEAARDAYAEFALNRFERQRV